MHLRLPGQHHLVGMFISFRISCAAAMLTYGFGPCLQQLDEKRLRTHTSSATYLVRDPKGDVERCKPRKIWDEACGAAALHHLDARKSTWLALQSSTDKV